MKLQELFDKAVKPLIEQGRRAYDVLDEVCWYRAPCGAKCAVGWIITDEFYSESLENQSINSSAVQHAVAQSLGQDELESDQYNLLEDLQSAHDDIGVLRRNVDGDLVFSDEEQLAVVVSNIRVIANANHLIFDEGVVA